MSPKDKLKSQWWRLNHLYKIVDKQGRIVTFKANWAQTALYSKGWYFNLILKARQLGITTYKCLLNLDDALFYPNTKCGIIAHNRDDAESFFGDKIKFAYDNLPEEIKALRPATSDSARELAFSNGSSIRVGTSLRSTTLQRLHISEHGKICAKFPDKATEIKTGAINTVQVGQRIDIESTAEGAEGDFYSLVQDARNKARTGERLTKLDWKFWFFPWHHHPEYVLDHQGFAFCAEMLKYFDDLENNHDIRLSEDQKAWYSKKWETQQDYMKREYPSTPDEAFEASIIGAYYSQQLDKAYSEGRIGPVPYDPAFSVHTSWDLGMDDSTAIWFIQLRGQEVHWIDYYQNNGESLAHYKGVLDAKEYSYGTHIVPIDANKREADTRTVFDKAHDIGLNWTRLPRAFGLYGPEGTINLVRTQFRRYWIDKVKCSEGLKAVQNYKQEWDDKNGKFKDHALHNWAEHGASAMRYGAIAIELGLLEQTQYSYQDYRREMIERRAVPGL